MLHLAHRTVDQRSCCAQAAHKRFLVLAALLFAATAIPTLILCERMAHMEPMPMPNGGSMSMMWMRMPGQSWPGIAGAFMGMWSLMMVAMMTPVLVPALTRYRRTLAAQRPTKIEIATLAFATGYFLVWCMFGFGVFAVGAAFAAVSMHVAMVARFVPIIAGAVILSAGLWQLSAWKAQQLHHCYHGFGTRGSKHMSGAWMDGLKLGLRCLYCCAPLTAILLAFGMMDVRVMTILTIATALERTRRIGLHVAQVTGLVASATGAWLLAHIAF